MTKTTPEPTAHIGGWTIDPDLKMNKTKSKLKVKEIILFCTACTQIFRVNKKDENGNIIKQQVCPHTILEEVR